MCFSPPRPLLLHQCWAAVRLLLKLIKCYPGNPLLHCILYFTLSGAHDGQGWLARQDLATLELWLKYHQTASKRLSKENNMGRGGIKSRTTEIRKRAGQAAGCAGFCINQLSFRFGSEPLPSQSKRENGEVHHS